MCPIGGSASILRYYFYTLQAEKVPKSKNDNPKAVVLRIDLTVI
jgi:hypothetical protein